MALLVLLVAGAWFWWPDGPPSTSDGTLRQEHPIVEDQRTAFAKYAGSGSCRECHGREFQAWMSSHHGLAERLPREELDREAIAANHEASASVSGARESGAAHDGFGIRVVAAGIETNVTVDRVIGHEPLRQYLLPVEGGRWQAFDMAWDPHTSQWFNVHGAEDRQLGEWGHWTGRGMNWNSMCATCHNTRFRKNYDEGSDTYNSAMAEMSVGCEACHGPMADHVRWQETWKGSGDRDPTLVRLSPTQRLESCAPCHARRSELTGDFQPGASFWDHFDLAIVDDREVFHPDGQIHEEDYEFAPFLGSRMHAAGVTCTDCHEPHSGKTKLAGNSLCLQCHNGSRPPAPVIHPETHTFHLPGTPGSECVHCHMPQTVFMENDWRHDHGFTTPDPVLTREWGIPNACNRCHANRDADWAIEVCETWYGARMTRRVRERTRTLASARRGDETSIPALLALLRSEEAPYWKAVAIGLLERWLQRPEVRDTIERQVAHSHPLVRGRAVRVLGTLVDADGAELRTLLRGMLSDPVRGVRIAAAWELRGELGLESRAGRELEHMLSLNADQPLGQAQRAVFELDRGRPALAREHYAKSIEWDPLSVPLRRDFAVLLSALGLLPEALFQTREAARLEPLSAENHYRLGLALNETGDLQGAVGALEEAVRLDAQHERALYNLGLAYHRVGRSTDAVELLSRAERCNPEDPRIPYARATVLVQQGRRDEAMTAAERALELDAAFGPALELRDWLMR
jgi:predicted CXXCH cytochrome family protein